MQLRTLLKHSWESYSSNFALISLFALPFLVVFPISLLLPNYIALGGTFLRFGSIQHDLSLLDVFMMISLVVVSLFLFSLVLVVINMLIKSQRTLLKLSYYERSLMKRHTLNLFLLLIIVLTITLAAELFLYSLNLHLILGAFISFLIGLLILFAPQAITIDELGPVNAIKKNLEIIRSKSSFMIFFFLLAIFLLSLNTFIFKLIEPLFPYSPYFAVAVNAVIVMPYLEVLKTHIYLSKYAFL